MSVRPRPRQLAFSLDHDKSFARDDFLTGPSNAAAAGLIERWPDWPNPVVVLTGPEGAGKSHLAAIWAETTGARFLAGRALGQADLHASLSTGALVLEDLAGSDIDERRLFHLLNLAREEGAFVLVTARTAPAGWALQIPDLASRLRALPAVELGPPDDVLLRAVLVKLFADRQLAVEENLVGYLSVRIERSFAAAQHIVQRLDDEALRRQRPVSRVMAAEIMISEQP